ncbi:hypothetical protein [Variovorax boronicumulans]|uniref:hypothetical protein n=1 Tax=Variovorax boronicumulans TaxID=436515 RepID=UPI0012E4B74E|nr:hypothetical protein [Variovorax boronicumulans]GER17579.1 hypothetical protein VCH24_25940 [Variovorax boronicumulans]
MSQFPSLDPMALWRELTAQWEKSTNEFANEAMASDPFRQGMHGGMNASLTAQKAVGDLMARYLTLLNLPTRADLQALGEQLHRIDDHLAGIRRALEGGARPAARTSDAAATAPARPRRTKQPPPTTAPAPAAKAAAPKKRPAGKRRP